MCDSPIDTVRDILTKITVMRKHINTLRQPHLRLFTGSIIPGINKVILNDISRPSHVTNLMALFEEINDAEETLLRCNLPMQFKGIILQYEIGNDENTPTSLVTVSKNEENICIITTHRYWAKLCVDLVENIINGKVI